MHLPKDPYILLSLINTKLRNEYHSLDDLCKSLHINPDELTVSLTSIGYAYDEKKNQFISNN